ncbi:MAG: hypothetical protein IKY22_00335 [Bacteroidales bacterium]|nr:hypothetical protein [Bacteroidales bacterium]MBR5776905.1 hypothetical protein [Bacteroidales bacterium]
MSSIIWTIVACLLSSGVMGIFAYFVIKRFVDNEQKKALVELRKAQSLETLKVVNPIRLQAYERLALFLERISPNSLVLRCYQPGMDLRVLQGVMTKNIRDEFEHNLSQQIYVSSEAWSRVKGAKEEMINVINSAAVKMEGTTDISNLVGVVFESIAKQNPIDSALEFLKNEIRQSFE